MQGFTQALLGKYTIKLSQGTLGLGIGSAAQLFADVEAGGAWEIENSQIPSVTWSSSDNSVARVNNRGSAHALCV